MKCPQCNGFGYIDNLEGDGLKCPKCNGTGEVGHTNEEWFCELPTRKKANVLFVMSQSYGAISVESYERWLKAVHK